MVQNTILPRYFVYHDAVLSDFPVRFPLGAGSNDPYIQAELPTRERPPGFACGMNGGTWPIPRAPDSYHRTKDEDRAASGLWPARPHSSASVMTRSTSLAKRWFQGRRLAPPGRLNLFPNGRLTVLLVGQTCYLRNGGLSSRKAGYYQQKSRELTDVGEYNGMYTEN